MLQEDDQESLTSILQILQQKLVRSHPKIVTKALWEEAMEDSSSTNVRKVSSSSDDSWQLIEAFDTPKLVYDSLRQQFHYESNPSKHLLGTARDKIQMMTQRYLKIQQRVARQLDLTCIDRLLGTSVHSSQLLLGMLHRMPNGSLELEDLTGSIPLQMDPESSIIDSKGEYNQGCFVIIQGSYDQGIFQVQRMGLPPLERKSQSEPLLPPRERLSTPQHPLTIYSMSNLALDDPGCLEELEQLVELLSDETDESVLVLMGNFTTDSLSFAAAMDELSRILEEVPSKHSVLVVPGPNDSPSAVWPLPKLKSSALSQLNHVQLVSNPCRIHFGSHQVVIARTDGLRQRRPILSVPSETTFTSRVVHTMLSQGHLLPHATPTYWNYDHAMGLYPLPDLLLLGGLGEESFDYSKAQCHVVAAGAGWVKMKLGKRRTSSPLRVEYSQDLDDDNSVNDMEERGED